MSEGGAPASSRQLMWTVSLLGTIFALCSIAQGQNATSAASSSATGPKAGTIVDTHSDKRVVQTGRWYVTRQFTVDFSVKCTDQTYCGKDIDVTLQNGRRIKAHQVAANKCAQN
jgi:hypothetical protein